MGVSEASVKRANAVLKHAAPNVVDMGIPITEPIQSVRGGRDNAQGTWVHPQSHLTWVEALRRPIGHRYGYRRRRVCHGRRLIRIGRWLRRRPRWRVRGRTLSVHGPHLCALG
jgi:hypothetical protein